MVGVGGGERGGVGEGGVEVVGRVIKEVERGSEYEFVYEVVVVERGGEEDGE